MLPLDYSALSRVELRRNVVPRFSSFVSFALLAYSDLRLLTGLISAARIV